MKIVSFFPGRIRVCSDAFRKEAVLSVLRARVEAIPGVRSFAGNARTGSVTIEYDPVAITNDMLLAARDELERMEGELRAG